MFLINGSCWSFSHKCQYNVIIYSLPIAWLLFKLTNLKVTKLIYNDSCSTPYHALRPRQMANIWQIFLAATKQLYEWFSPSVRPSVCPSVRPSVRLSVTPFWLCSHHPIIMKFSGVITSDKSDVHAKGQGQRSKVKVTEVTTQIFVSGL